MSSSQSNITTFSPDALKSSRARTCLESAGFGHGGYNDERALVARPELASCPECRKAIAGSRPNAWVHWTDSRKPGVLFLRVNCK